MCSKLSTSDIWSAYHTIPYIPYHLYAHKRSWSDDNPDLSPAPSDHSDSDSDSQGDEEGVHWEWMNIPATLGGGRVKLMLDQRERRKRRRAARNA